MTKSPQTFYRYRAFSTTTLDALCNDTIHFAHPVTFNDPLDCNPTLECDSPIHELRELLAHLIKNRVRAEVLFSLKQAKIKGQSATELANKAAHRDATNALSIIAYYATNPDYEVEVIQAESSMLIYEIEREILRHYDRGVCCYSATYSSPLLWSHYGDHHKGLCIGYSTERKPLPQLSKVIYGGNRSIKSSMLVNAFLSDNKQALDRLDEAVLLRKASGWKYEKEWRLIGDQGVQDSPLLLKEVTFGIRCSDSVLHAVVKALEGRENETQFFVMYVVRGGYALRRKRLDLNEHGIFFPRTAISGLEAFGPADSD